MKGLDISDRVRPLDMYPYDDYKVILKPLAHLHYAYRIENGGITIELSDYLKDAPDKVINDTCKAIIKWSSGRKYVAPDSLMDYISSDDFIVRSRPVYLDRSRSFRRDQQGAHKNLLDSIERLMESGLVLESDIQNSYITWAEHMAKYRFGQCNQMFRVISVNPDLDSDSVPDTVVDYVVYHEILHLRQGVMRGHRPHNAKFRGWEHSYPDYERIENYLRNFYVGRRRSRQKVGLLHQEARIGIEHYPAVVGVVQVGNDEGHLPGI